MGPDAGKARGQSCPHFVLQQFIGLGLFVITTLLPLIATAQFTGGPPVINSQPKSQLVAAGTDVTFSVGTAPSFTPVRYQWRKAGADLAGATNSTLVISNAALGAAGNYNVVVANAAGAIPSDTATLTVAQASATPPSVSLGASVRLGVNTFSPTLGGYQWGFDGVIIPGATNRTLVLTNVQLANAGTYTVSVTNEVGSVTLSTTLSVDLTFTKIIGVDPVKPVEGNQPFVPHGCAWIDYNDDGYLDLLAWNIGNEVVHVRLFRNNRNGTFAPVPAPALINSFDGHSVATPADFDNDGYVDLLVSPLSPAKLFRNNHDGTFISVGAGQLTSQNQIRPPPNEAEEVGLGGAPVLSAWADYDNDGRVDVLLNTSLYKNNGDGTFTNTTAATFGPTRGADKAFAARSWGDYDNDGYLDLFVFNWAGNNVNLLYHNNGDGTFKETASVASVNEGAAYSWTCGWGDYDNDGFLDLFVANNDPVRRNFLYHNNQNGTFSRSEAFDAVSPTNQWTYGCAWGDYDNDGFLDLYLSNGNAANNQNLLYHNNGDGTFTGILTGSPVNDADSFGACSWADYNNDGFLDLYVASATGNNRLYRNNTNNNSWVKVKCAGTVSNRAAIGAKVRVNAFYQGASRWQLREITGGDGDGNSQPLLAHFGLGDATNIDTVCIEWPSGIVQAMRNVAVKQFLPVTESVLTVQPKAQDFVGGADFTFNVATNSTSSTNYQWRFNGTELAGETNGVLSVLSVGASSAGKYTVVVMFPNGDTVESGPAILKPPVPPNITAHPQNQTVDPGGTATFQVIATGSPPLLYQWRLNEAPIEGATEATLTVTNVQPVNAGDYTVEVRNAAGAVTSTNATLGLVGAPLIYVHPRDQSVSLGANVAFIVGASGTPPFTYQWRLNGADIEGATNRTLSITNVALANNDQRYNVVVRNALGSDPSRDAVLTVDPTFTKITSGSVVTSGGTSKGAAWVDFDDDGWIDLFVVNTFNEKNFLYQNNRDGTFTRITAGAIVNDIGDFDTCAWGDYDNDGNIDVVVTSGLHNGGRNFLYRNLGNATFERISSGPIVSVFGYFTGTAWGDYDRDGFLDLFLANWGPDLLVHNNGNLTFTQVTAGPIVTDRANSSNGSWADFDNDGDLDLVVDHAGDGVSERTYLYRNDGDGSFTRLSAPPITTEGGLSVGCAWGDYDNDGLPDLFVANYRGYALDVPNQNNSLYHNEGNGVFSKITAGAIVNDLSDSFGASWGDYDNDGFLDLFVSNVRNRDNFLYHNNGDRTFTKVTAGSLVHDGGESVACVWGDYNNDGFLDLFVANGANTASQNDFLYLNNTNGNNWINIKCVGTASNRSAIGAKVRVKAFYQNEIRWQLREISGGNGSSGQNDLRANFGLGDATNIDTVRIEWPSGIIQEMRNVAVKQFLTATEPVVTITPKIQELVLGSDLTFTVSNNLSGPLIYQWRFNGTNIVGQTNATLVVSNAQGANVGKYAVALTNPATGDFVISASALLRLPGFPQITVQPQSQAVDAGTQVTLQVTAIGAEPLYYQWRLFEENVPGATNSTLTITNVLPVHAGDYTVVVSNLVGSVTSQAASLNLLGVPGISQQPKNQSVSLGATAIFAVSVFGTPPFTFQWRSNGVDIPGATTSRLVLTNMTIDFRANYSVVVSNSLNSVTSQSARLDVDPTFTKITAGPMVTETSYAAGATWGDYNDDGFIDLFLGQESGNNNRLYRNLTNGTFGKITTGRIVNDGGDTRGTVWGDYDNDGFLDLFVTNGDGLNFLYHNDGGTNFTRILTGRIATDSGDSRGAVWGDYDNDGFLDLYVPHAADGIKVLYHNNGDGTFSRVSAGSLTTDRGYSLGASWGDFNNDGLLDLFVTNLGDNAGKTNFFYQNDGWGSFTKITTGGIVTDLGDGVGCAWGDYDNDDFLDMFVTNDGVLGEKVNFLYHNNGNGTFIRLTDSSVGPVVTDPALAWDCAWADYDNDGYLDLFVVNAAGLNNLLYHNNRDETFTKITQGSLVNDTAGIAYDRGSRSCTWGDYDNDGFLDLFVGNYGGINSLYRNNGNSNSWIKFKLVGTASNRSAIGAKVRVTATIGGKTVRQLREISGGGGYRSQNGLLPHFGLGDATSIDTVRIEWPSGTVQELHNVAVKQTLKVVEPPRLGGLARQTDDSVQLNLIGAAGVPFRVETSSNLLNWTPLVTITNRSRTEIIVETNAANFPQRFYRALTP